MIRKITGGKDPFGRPFTLDLDAIRRRRAAVDHNRATPSPAKRKSIPLSVLKHSP